MERRNTVIALLWIGGVAAAAHLLYSSLGFNPTDDGFTLAYSRRLLLGQVPHRDFISIRPILSPAMHMPEVLFGGAYTYWLSRFVFFLEWAVTAWFSTAFIIRGLGLKTGPGGRAALALVSFVFGCHTFPAMAWHTVDGILLSVLGLYFRSRTTAGRAWPAYLLLGAAYLCKQGFVFVAPAALFLFGDARNRKCLAAAAAPGALYLIALALSGAWTDGLQQLFSQTGLIRYGVLPYLGPRTLTGLAAGFAAAHLLAVSPDAGRRRRGPVRRLAGLLVIAAAFALAVRGLMANGVLAAPFGLFGMVCGAVIRMVLGSSRRSFPWIRTGIILVVLAWSAALSIGYTTPAFASGMLLVFLLGLVYRDLDAAGSRLRPLVPVVAAVVAVVAFHYARTHHVYRDRPAAELTETLGDVLPGGRLIRTNPNTYAFLADLDRAIDAVESRGMSFTIVPDLAAYWVKAEAVNPLPIDWPQGIELNTPALFDRVTQAIEDGRPGRAVLLQKVGAEDLALGFSDLKTVEREWFHTVVVYVREHLDPVGETEYFEIYR